jgi:uncharacterized protein
MAARAEMGAAMEPEVCGKLRQPIQYAAAASATRKMAMLKLIARSRGVEKKLCARLPKALEPAAGLEEAPPLEKGTTPNCSEPSCRTIPTMMSDMGPDESLIREIVRRVLSVARPDRIILFGSAATGKMTKDSDIDLLVLEKAPGNRLQRSVEILDALDEIEYPFDVIVMATERFERTKRWIGGIAYPANKYGRVIYEST